MCAFKSLIMLFSFDVSLASAPQQLSRSNLDLSFGGFLFTNSDFKALKAIREVTVSQWFSNSLTAKENDLGLSTSLCLAK